MQRQKLIFAAICFLVVSHWLQSVTLAQRKSLPAGLNQQSTVQDILAYLNRESFPHARILLSSHLPGEQEWDPAAMDFTETTRLLIFSEGFRLASGVDDCHLKLINDDVRIHDAEKKKIQVIDLASVTKSKSPYAVEFSTWLETASHNKGRRSFLYTGRPEKAALMDGWQSTFQSRGFFVRTIFGYRFPALINSYYISSTEVTFSFVDQHMSEQFDVAFRRLIKLCQRRSTKARWRS